MIQVSEVIIITTWISVDYPLTSPVCEVHTLFIKITELFSLDTSKILFLIIISSYSQKYDEKDKKD